MDYKKTDETPETTIVVIMRKDEKTGFLENEVTNCAVTENGQYLVNIYAVKKEKYYVAHIKLSVESVVEDWQFDAIYDYYDEGVFDGLADSFAEVEDCCEPTWEITMKFTLDGNLSAVSETERISSIDEFEEKLNTVLAVHKAELDSVFTAIADKKDEYQ